MLTCLRGALPPVDLRAVCLVRAMVMFVSDFYVKGVTYCSFCEL